MASAAEGGCPLCRVILSALKDDELAPSPIEEEENDVCLQFTAYMMGFESEAAIDGAGATWYDFNCLCISRKLTSGSWLPLTFLSVSAVLGI